jgi:hypothetical protein
MNDTVMTLKDYTDKFPEIADAIRGVLDDLGDELQTNDADNAFEITTNIMVQVGQLHALQAIALGIQELTQKGS